MLKNNLFKKISFILIIGISFFIFSGCSKDESSVDKPANLKEITGKIEKANFDSNGNIVIAEATITTNITYIDYEYEGVNIGLLAVRDSKDKVQVVVNTCQSCGGSPYAYFVKVGDSIQCQNCGNMFKIDELDNLAVNGCNPIAIVNKKEKDGKITIVPDELKALKSKFTNWQGPKAV